MILKKKIEVIKNPKGDIIKYLNKSNNFLKSVKEVYFTEIKKGYKKGWIKHTKTKCFLLVIDGKIRFFYTKNFKKKKIITLSSKKPKGVIVKPGTWFAFESLVKKSVLVNSIEIYHDPKESLKYQIDN